MEIERVSTGVDELDKLIEGGIPVGSNILLVGPPGVGKTIFVLAFTSKAIANGDCCIYVCVDQLPEEVQYSLQKFGLNVKSAQDEGRLIFIDVYSWRFGKIPKDKRWYVSNIVNLNELLIRISEAMKSINEKFPEKRIRIVLDSISTLIMYAEFIPVFKMLQLLAARSKLMKAVGLYTLEAGVHEPKVSAGISYIMDGVIEMKWEGEKRYIRILKMRATTHRRDWIPFEIDEEGIKLKI